LLNWRMLLGRKPWRCVMRLLLMLLMMLLLSLVDSLGRSCSCSSSSRRRTMAEREVTLRLESLWRGVYGLTPVVGVGRRRAGKQISGGSKGRGSHLARRGLALKALLLLLSLRLVRLLLLLLLLLRRRHLVRMLLRVTLRKLCLDWRTRLVHEWRLLLLLLLLLVMLLLLGLLGLLLLLLLLLWGERGPLLLLKRPWWRATSLVGVGRGGRATKEGDGAILGGGRDAGHLARSGTLCLVGRKR